MKEEITLLKTKKFTDEQKEAIKKVRKEKGLDKPTFYHEAIIKYCEVANG